MNRIVCVIVCVLSLWLNLHAQKHDAPPALLSMVDTERAFARMSEEQGIRPSFMAFIAEDGILFRPKAVKGKQWMHDHPLPPADKRDLLSWAPSFADMAAAGDMGYTFGPWQYRADIHDARPVAWGHFLTIWKKQADGSWKFAIDLGISHPEPPHEALLPEQTINKPRENKTSAASVDKERQALLALEREFSQDANAVGAQIAFLAHSAANVRVLREGTFPLTGKAAIEAVPSAAGVWTWEPEGGDVSRSRDLGYSYGTYWLKSGDASVKPVTGNYFRIWKKQAGVWKVVVDLANPVLEKKS